MNGLEIAQGLVLALNGALHIMRLLTNLGVERQTLITMLETAAEEQRDLSADEIRRALAGSQSAINALRAAQEKAAARERDGEETM